jgi:uncharacterized protein (TIGR01777 family)
MPTVLITGGTGLIGTALSQHLLNEGYNVIILSRNPQETASRHGVDAQRKFFRYSGNIYYSRWNIREMTIDPAAFKEADYIVHLAGAGVADKRWTDARKKEILESRTRSSALLLKYLKNEKNKVKAVISASAIGWYGPDNGKVFTENDPPARDFLGQTCEAWENSIDPVVDLGKRLVKLRTGIVLSNDGGALAEFKKPIRFGVAAVLGDGKQMTSWVHIDDVCRAFIHAIEYQQMHGVYNLTAPSPVTHEQLTVDLATQMKGKMFIRSKVPAAILKLVLGEMSIEILKSATVSSEKLQHEGFSFLFPDLHKALNDLIGSRKSNGADGIHS